MDEHSEYMKKLLEEILLLKESDIIEITPQIVGNIGLYYVCYQLSKNGWYVVPTARNAKGVDVIIYKKRSAGSETHTIQVKSLSDEKNRVPIGNIKNLFADFLIICRNVDKEPKIFICRTQEIIKNNNLFAKDKNGDNWLKTNGYEKYYTNDWGILDNP